MYAVAARVGLAIVQAFQREAPVQSEVQILANLQLHAHAGTDQGLVELETRRSR